MKVSIITPCYNAERFIRETIESVRAQTHRDWEMLITDDCSKDSSAKIVEEIAAQDPRVILIRSAKNGGPAEARNQSLRQATGQMVAFLDSDDLWVPTKLETQLGWMKEHGSRFSFTQYRRMSEDGTQLGSVIQIPESLSYDQLLANTAITTSTTLLDRDLLRGIELESGWGYDDFVLWLRILKTGATAHGIAQDLVRYRVVQGSVSRKSLRSAGWVWRIYREHEHLGLLRSAYSLASYGLRAVIKHQK
ncbi:MAG: glycosyltransferase family 2 protein [Bdellovibrionales bacterium]|nr:glycosyltransferase family 2 protein [Bdellovibrionales bacterium]